MYPEGTRVIIVSNDPDEPGVIEAASEDDHACHVRLDSTGEVRQVAEWMVVEEAAVERVHVLFMEKLAERYPDHPWVTSKPQCSYPGCEGGSLETDDPFVRRPCPECGG